MIDFQGMGYYFVEFCALYGYGDVLALLGRYPEQAWIFDNSLPFRELRDFLNGLDNLHEYLKFSYPRWPNNIAPKSPKISH